VANPSQKSLDLFFTVERNHQPPAFGEMLAGIKTGANEQTPEFGKFAGTGRQPYFVAPFVGLFEVFAQLGIGRRLRPTVFVEPAGQASYCGLSPCLCHSVIMNQDRVRENPTQGIHAYVHYLTRWTRQHVVLQ